MSVRIVRQRESGKSRGGKLGRWRLFIARWPFHHSLAPSVPVATRNGDRHISALHHGRFAKRSRPLYITLMATFELSDDQMDALVRYVRAKLAAERFPNWSAYRPLREALDVLTPPKPRVPSSPVKIYAPPRATAQQRRGRDPRR